MSTYGCEECWGVHPKYTIDLQTRKIRFGYTLSEDLEFDFDLLSHCRDDVQDMLKNMMKEDGIVLGILDTEDEYCNVVMFADLPWEDENGDIIEEQ